MRKRLTYATLAVWIAAAAACGSSSSGPPADAGERAPDARASTGNPTDGGPPDAVVADAGPPDSGLAAAKGDPSQQVTSASGRVASEHYQVDVQFGHMVPQSRVTSATYTVEGPTPVNR